MLMTTIDFFCYSGCDDRKEEQLDERHEVSERDSGANMTFEFQSKKKQKKPQIEKKAERLGKTTLTVFLFPF